MNSILAKIIDSCDEKFPAGWETEETPRGERRIVPTCNATTAKLSKSFLNKFIKWSSSRYNEYKKAEVVDAAYKILSGEWEDSVQVYHSGSFCQCSTMTETGTYLVHGPEKYIAKIKEVWNPETRVSDLIQIERVDIQ